MMRNRNTYIGILIVVLTVSVCMNIQWLKDTPYELLRHSRLQPYKTRTSSPSSHSPECVHGPVTKTGVKCSKIQTVMNGGKSSSLHVQRKTKNKTNMKLPGINREKPGSGIRQQKRKIEHIIYVKAHKSASTTVQSIFFRYGYTRNLSFVTATSDHYVNERTGELKELAPPRGDHYDILCNHGFFRHNLYSAIMPNDSVYIGIVREPVRQFISSVHYYTTIYHFKYLMKVPGNKIEQLINHPSLYEKYSLSYTMNSMARDFGFTEKQLILAWNGSTSAAEEYLEKLGTIFDLVLVAEYLDECIILLKRLLNWSLKDFLYIAKNVLGSDTKLDSGLLEKLKRRNILDFMLYDYFLERTKQKIKQAGPSLIEESTHFKNLLLRVNTFCQDQYFGELSIPATQWNEAFVVDSRDCELMAKGELAFVNALRKRQMPKPPNTIHSLK